MIPFQLEITSSNTKVRAQPMIIIQRGKIAVRNPIVQVEMMKTPAIFRTNILKSASLTWWPKW